MNPYAILGIPQNASKEEIKKAYKQLSKQYHPDVNSSPDAEDKFKEINKAYEMLTKYQPQPRPSINSNPFVDMDFMKNFNFSHNFNFNQTNAQFTLSMSFTKNLSQEDLSKILKYVDELGIGVTSHSYTCRT